MPIYSGIKVGSKIQRIDKAMFEHIYDCTADEISVAAESGRIIPYFANRFSAYDPEAIKSLVKAGSRRITREQMQLVKKMGMCQFVSHDCKFCRRRAREIRKRLPKINGGCLACLGLMWNSTGESLSKWTNKKSAQERVSLELCLASKVILSRNLGAVFQTKCPVGKRALSRVSEVYRPSATEFVCQGLKVNYTKDIPLKQYLEIVDSKATKAMRQVVQGFLKDPRARKFDVILNGKIVEYNQQLEDFGKSKAARIYKALSDLAVYGGTKFVEEQTRKYIKLSGKMARNISEYVASEALDLHAKVFGKDWTVAQLYRTRCRLEACKRVATPSRE